MTHVRAISGFVLLAAVITLAARLDAPAEPGATGVLQAWVYQAGSFQSAGFSQAGLESMWQSASPLAETSSDITIQAGQAVVSSPGSIKWNSPAGWQVKQAAWTDLDGDGTQEAALLVWRPYAPWPIDRYLPNPGRIASHQDENGQSCHLILISFESGRGREKWAGSALAQPLLSFLPADLDRDGRQDLLALQGDYGDLPGSPSRALTGWEWNGFGFTLMARIPGAFREVRVLELDGSLVILTFSR